MKLDEIRSLAGIMKDAGLTSLEVCEEGVKVRLEKKQPLPPAAPMFPVPPAAQAAPGAQATEVPAAPAGEKLREIRSPMVGVFYAAASPENEPYVKVGSAVKKGDVVCIIEAMKLLNEINADADGEIAEVCAENGQVVEYGQTLFRLR